MINDKTKECFRDPVNYQNFTLLGDINITKAFHWSQDLNQNADLLLSSIVPNQRAIFINSFNDKFGAQIAAKYDSQLVEERSGFLENIGKFSKKELSDLSGTDEAVSGLILKLWGACILICKYIDPGRKDITSDVRKKEFTNVFDPIANNDSIFCLGMKTAIAFCKLRKEEYTLDGVPEDSPIKF